VPALARLALLFVRANRLHSDASRVGGDAERGLHRVVAHRVDECRAEGPAEFVVPARERATIDGQTLRGKPLLLPEERQSVSDLVDDRVCEKRRSRDAAAQDFLGQRRRLHHGGAGQALELVLHTLRDEHDAPAALVRDAPRLLDAVTRGLAVGDELIEPGVGDLHRLDGQLQVLERAPALRLWERPDPR